MVYEMLDKLSVALLIRLRIFVPSFAKISQLVQEPKSVATLENTFALPK